MTQPSVFFSNRIEILWESLKDHLFASSSPFARRLIVVPSPLMKSWLLGQMAHDPQLNIAMGVEVEYLQQAIIQLLQLVDGAENSASKNIPSGLELALILEGKIKGLLPLFGGMGADEQRLWKPLLDYLKISLESTALSRKSEKRLAFLCERLAALFVQYGTYGGRMVQAWEKRSGEGWQHELWKLVFCGENPCSYPYRELLSFLSSAKNGRKRSDIQVEVFGIAFLPHLHEMFLSKIAQTITIRYYVLSPCQGFWSDIRSTRAQAHLSMSGKIPVDFLDELQQPLLSNLGKLGQKMAIQIENSDAVTEARYVLPSSVEEEPEYASLLMDEVELHPVEHPMTLLEAIQTDMVLLRHPEAEKIDIAADDSIQLHVASSRLREVQIVYDRLLAVIEKHAQDEHPICPSDITVMAPDIMEYQASIKAVFGGSDSRLDFQLYDLKMQAQSSLVQGFLHLLDLANGRWEAPALMQLFEYPEFQRRHRFRSEELQQLRAWIQETGIRWGDDIEHRDEILGKHGYTEGLVRDGHAGTWEGGLSRLLLGLVMKLERDPDQQFLVSESLDCLPLDGVDVVQGPLLGRWIQLLRSLREDLKPLSNGRNLSLEEWSSYLKCLVESYFAFDLSDSSAESGYQALLDQLTQLSHASEWIGKTDLNWVAIRSYLDRAFAQQTMNYRENHLQAVRFCSMLPMRAVPSKVVLLMGLQEGVFPKRKEVNALDLMDGDPSADYCPSATDYDRYLFLEAILSARKYLIISYPEESAGGLLQDVRPSLVVTELLSYLDSAYTLSGRVPSSACTFIHPFDPFDARYFNSDDPTFCSYSTAHYREALAHHHTEKHDGKGFIPEFLIQASNEIRTSTEPKEELCLDIKHLAQAARHPLKLYFNKTLGMYVDQGEERKLSKEDVWALSSLDSFLLKRAALLSSPERMLKVAEKQGQMPYGLFKTLASEQVTEDVQEWQKHLASFGVTAEDLFSITFHPHCQVPRQETNGDWIVPCLEIQTQGGVPMKVIGKLEGVTSGGLVVHAEDRLPDLFKYWFHCLILNKMFQHPSSFPAVKPYLLFLKSGKKRSIAIDQVDLWMERYIAYYLHCLEHPCLMLPDWIPDLLKQDPQTFEEKVRKNVDSSRSHLSADDLLWALRGQDLFEMNRELLSFWKEQVHHFFGEAALPLVSKDKEEGA